MINSCKSVFLDTRTWEQQEWNTTKEQKKRLRIEAWGWKEVQRPRKTKEVPELITTKSKYNNLTKFLSILYKRWKKYNEIKCTKNKMDLNNRKMLNHPPSHGSQTSEQVPFSTATKNVKLVLKCCSQHLSTRTARISQVKGTEADDKQKKK